ncbi:MAG: prepilin-type N-terminal cleavage/methylation domain-containing protein [Planctomycetota bacterium]|nr:prepilin-type N-terminal cleavage/methylation domain-containing protein [Planctomycetota bacterium]
MPARQAFTLIEAMIASVILAVTVTAVSLPFTAGAQNEQDSARVTLAVALAEELMEEILSKPFADPNGVQTPGPEAGETGRSLYDNIDDYHGYSEADGQIKDVNGVACTGLLAKGLSRGALAEYVYLFGQSTAQSPSIIRVTVTVSYKGRAVSTLQRLVYRNGA